MLKIELVEMQAWNVEANNKAREQRKIISSCIGDTFCVDHSKHVTRVVLYAERDGNTSYEIKGECCDEYADKLNAALK